MVQSSVPPPVLAMVNGWLVVVLVPCVLSRLNGLTSMLGGPPVVTTSSNGTCTSGVTGSLLSTHSVPVYVLGDRPVESKVTLTAVLLPGVVVPAAGLTLAHGMSSGAEQVTANGSRTMSS